QSLDVFRFHIQLRSILRRCTDDHAALVQANTCSAVTRALKGEFGHRSRLNTRAIPHGEHGTPIPGRPNKLVVLNVPFAFRIFENSRRTLKVSCRQDNRHNDNDHNRSDGRPLPYLSATNCNYYRTGRIRSSLRRFLESFENSFPRRVIWRSGYPAKTRKGLI